MEPPIDEGVRFPLNVWSSVLIGRPHTTFCVVGGAPRRRFQDEEKIKEKIKASRCSCNMLIPH